MNCIDDLTFLKQNKRGRGRPRKSTICNTVDQDKIKRPMLISKPILKSLKSESEPEIILHLPATIQEYKSGLNVNPSPVSESTKANNIFTIENMNSEPDYESEYSDDSNNHYIITELKQKNKELEKTITKLEKDLGDCKSIIKNTYGKANDRKLTKIDLKLVNTDGDQYVLSPQTNIACWWCTYNFDTQPLPAPMKLVNDTYQICGCYCTLECMVSYIFNNNNDSSVWEKLSLLKKMYDVENVQMAPPREVFEKFGGPLSYQEYRKNCNSVLKEYRLIMPPMASIIPMVEEGYTNSTRVNITLADLNNNCTLRRKNPLPGTKNSFFETLSSKEESKKKF